MLLVFYQLSVAALSVQALATPMIVVVAGIAWWRQAREIESLGKYEAPRGAGARPGGEQPSSLGGLFERLPKLAPLRCESCGAGLRLEARATPCTHCGAVRALPPDYAALAALKPLCASIVARANRHARVARVLAHPATRFAVRALALLEPVLFLILVIGAATYRDTAADRAFDAIGETLAFVVMTAAFLGFIVWMITFVMLSNLGRRVQRDLPALSDLDPAPRARERGTCAPCGAPIEYGGGAFAAACDYCHGVSYRARFAGAERARAEARTNEAGALLLGAMRHIEEFTGTLFFVLAILSVGCLLLSAATALGSD